MKLRVCHSILFACFAFLLIFSCQSHKSADKNRGQVRQFPIEYNYSKLEGIYSGDFGGSLIHVNLRKVTGRNIVGYSVHKGLKRNFSGIMDTAVNGFHLQLREPGNNIYDGIFDVTIDTLTLVFTGNWIPRGNRDLHTISFVLTKKTTRNDENYSSLPIYYDSLNTLSFLEDGMCTYEFYPEINGSLSIQLVTIRGNWTQQGNQYKIEFEKSPLLTQSTYFINVDSASLDTTSNYHRKFIKLNNRILYQAEY